MICTHVLGKDYAFFVLVSLLTVSSRHDDWSLRLLQAVNESCLAIASGIRTHRFFKLSGYVFGSVFVAL